jgi:hypothetical protein
MGQKLPSRSVAAGVCFVPLVDIGGLMTPGEGSPRKRAVAFVASTSLCCVAPFPFPF